jgi:hypothetical protein
MNREWQNHRIRNLFNVILQHTKNMRIIFSILAIPIISFGGCIITTANAEDTFWEALKGGKFDFSARWRYEHVDDNIAADQANAATIRTTLGYTTGIFHGFGARLLVQDVRDTGLDDFNDLTGRPSAKTNFAVVADPSETDFLEAYLSYAGVPNTTAKLGRQIITYRDAPHHRYMGTVLWRQNWQNHDSFTVENKSLPDTIIRYAYSWNVNRIFTDESIGTGANAANFDSDSHFVNIQYGGLPYGKFEGYAYLLDFENSLVNSTETYGLRFNGGYPVAETAKIIYTAEYAIQDDYGDNPANVDEDYFLGEIGASFKLGKLIDSVMVKFSYELLEGNGSTSFLTPLATGHAFQGWTDRFLATPKDGIEDYYLTMMATVLGAKIIAEYHDINSDNLDYDYGDELDLFIEKTFLENYTVGAKWGVYDADRNINNVTRNAGSFVGVANDVSKIWVWGQIKF